MTVKLTVTGDGAPIHVRVAHTSGDKCADLLAVDAVKKYTFPKRYIAIDMVLDVKLARKADGHEEVTLH